MDVLPSERRLQRRFDAVAGEVLAEECLRARVVDIFVGEALAFAGDRAAYMQRYRDAMAALALEEKHADWS
jgi:hypothetical protein